MLKAYKSEFSLGDGYRHGPEVYTLVFGSNEETFIDVDVP